MTGGVVDRRSVLAVIRPHEGIDHPISTRLVVLSLNLTWPRDWPMVRRAVDELLDEGHPIGSTTSRGAAGGYFYCVTYRDFATTIGQYEARIRKLTRRVTSLRRVMPQNPQGSLFENRTAR